MIWRDYKKSERSSESTSWFFKYDVKMKCLVRWVKCNHRTQQTQTGPRTTFPFELKEFCRNQKQETPTRGKADVICDLIPIALFCICCWSSSLVHDIALRFFYNTCRWCCSIWSVGNLHVCLQFCWTFCVHVREDHFCRPLCVIFR